MFYVPTKHISDSLYTSMRMPGKTFDVVRWIIGSEIVQEQKRVENRNFTEPECPFEVDTRAFNRGFALQNLCYLSSFNHYIPPYYEINCYVSIAMYQLLCINCYVSIAMYQLLCINYYEINHYEISYSEINHYEIRI